MSAGTVPGANLCRRIAAAGGAARRASARSISRLSLPRFVGRLSLLAGLLAAGCAQIQPPEGGPEDKTLPKVIGTYPDSGATRVVLGDSVVLLFNKTMNHHTVESAFIISPTVEYRERRWKDDAWILRLQRPLEAHRT